MTIWLNISKTVRPKMIIWPNLPNLSYIALVQRERERERERERQTKVLQINEGARPSIFEL